jgi:hypothetical protein
MRVQVQKSGYLNKIFSYVKFWWGENRAFGRPWHMWENNIKMNIKYGGG